MGDMKIYGGWHDLWPTCPFCGEQTDGFVDKALRAGLHNTETAELDIDCNYCGRRLRIERREIVQYRGVGVVDGGTGYGKA